MTAAFSDTGVVVAQPAKAIAISGSNKDLLLIIPIPSYLF
jgi:hypothetical protein